MIRIANVDGIRRIEAAADASGISYDTMMERAGHAVAQRALAIINHRPDSRVTILVGKGNNGGDGLVTGRILAASSQAVVRFYLTEPRDQDNNLQSVLDAGLMVAYAKDDQGHRVLRNLINSADLVIDALFGIGIRLPLKAEAASLMRVINQSLHQRREELQPELIQPIMPVTRSSSRGPIVLAVDCPSGLDCNSGETDRNIITANETVTFIAAKPGLLSFPGAAAAGQLYVAPIGIPGDLEALASEEDVLLDAEVVRSMLPIRAIDGNKGSFGKALIVGGSSNYMGAPGLSARAAYRAGAGLVTVAAPTPVVQALASTSTESTWLLLPHDMGIIAEGASRLVLAELDRYDALLIGPGMGREAASAKFLTALLVSAKNQHMPLPTDKRRIGFQAADTGSRHRDDHISLPPLVVDADGLNLLSEMNSWATLLPENSILTPHPGEMSRLSGLSVKEIQADRITLARSKAQEWQVVLVLKGAHTVIASPEGRIMVLPFKNDALATAGTGDVLAGIIVSLLAQGMEAFEAASCGAYLHGLCAESALETGHARSLIASDLIDQLPSVFRSLGL